MDAYNPVQQMKASRWLGGRGTRVLYSAIAVTIIGTLMTSQSISEARVESEKAAVSAEVAVKLASEVSQLCRGWEFREKNAEVCVRAAELLKNPAGGPTGLEVVDAAVRLP